MLVDGRPVSGEPVRLRALPASGTARRRSRAAAGPYFYLPKLESHLEARLWNDVFVAAQEAVGLPRGTIRATVLIETILAAFEMEEILYELREHSAGLNAGRWDYIFSAIKKFRDDPAFVLPDRAAVTMARAVHARLHRAAGARLPPPRRARDRRHGGVHPDAATPSSTSRRFAKVREDKEREAGDGFDGTWVAHPDLVPVAREIFDAVLGDRPEPEGRLREDVARTAPPCSPRPHARRDHARPACSTNVSVGLRYLDVVARAASARRRSTTSWRTPPRPRSRARSCGSGSATAAARARARSITPELYARERDAVLARLAGDGRAHLGEAAELLDGLVLDDGFAPFLTLRAGRLLP